MTPSKLRLHRAVIAMALTVALSVNVQADDDTDLLQTVTITAIGASNMIAASSGDIGQEQLSDQPLLRPGAILENVPGLIVTQHSGEGKANQYFLRAFNLDHGTDLATEVDDMPVNLPSHAHGQGYSDLNFLIPELISDLHYKKGPYYADEGDFATAGAVRMSLVDEAAPTASLGFGQDGNRRALLMGSTAAAAGELLAAGEVYRNDGPFDVPDDYHRLNGVLRYQHGTDRDYWTVTAMGYSGRWNSTDQVPQRAIDAGLIDRYGSLNPSDGGVTSRYSLSFNEVSRNDSGQNQLSAYVIRYKLDLWSTFTYYLVDPVNGDQMLQHDDRIVYGFKASKTWDTLLARMPMSNIVGFQARLDDIRDVGIFHTEERRLLAPVQNAGVSESATAIYFENSIQWLREVHTVLGLRDDYFDFTVRDKLLKADGRCDIASDPLGCDTGSRHASILSPKLGIVLGPWAMTRLFFSLASGYHSNDARGVTRSGQNPDDTPVTPLTRATSVEIGVSSQLIADWKTSLDVFELKLKSELVFDGDAGATTPSGATTRSGVEWSNRYRINHWLSADFNAAVSRARFDRNAAADDLGCGNAAPADPCAQPIAISGRYIPNSPTNVIDAGLRAQSPTGWFGALRARHFGAAPLVEDNSAKSAPYATVDAQLGIRPGSHWLVALDVFNIFNTRWNDIEYYYVSRLQNQSAAAADYVVHPGTPRTLRIRLQYRP
jgi:outer membrane receptor protein involved in Fe transport